MTESRPRVVDDPEAGRFQILVGDDVAGFAEYHRTSSATSFTHTVIDPAFEGQGLGSELARGALDATRAAGREVLPFCPFIRGYIEHHPEYLDLVPAGRRGEFRLASAAAT